jgi:hypothetical protein
MSTGRTIVAVFASSPLLAGFTVPFTTNVVDPAGKRSTDVSILPSPTALSHDDPGEDTQVQTAPTISLGSESLT